MTDELPDEFRERNPYEDGPAAPSAELVLRDRRPTAARRRWHPAVGEVRSRLLDLRHHPAAVASVSAAATVGSAALVTGLRQVLRHAAASPDRRTSSVTVVGYVLHEVHVFHHVVHHVGDRRLP